MFDGCAGADPTYSLNVRIIAKKAWQAHFVHNMFIRSENGELKDFKPGFTIINASDVTNDNFEEFGMNSETFILFHMEKRLTHLVQLLYILIYLLVGLAHFNIFQEEIKMELHM